MRDVRLGLFKWPHDSHTPALPKQQNWHQSKHWDTSGAGFSEQTVWLWSWNDNIQQDSGDAAKETTSVRKRGRRGRSRPCACASTPPPRMFRTFADSLRKVSQSQLRSHLQNNSAISTTKSEASSEGKHSVNCLIILAGVALFTHASDANRMENPEDVEGRKDDTWSLTVFVNQFSDSSVPGTRGCACVCGILEYHYVYLSTIFTILGEQDWHALDIFLFHLLYLEEFVYQPCNLERHVGGTLRMLYV